MSNSEYREAQQQAREAGLAKRQEVRLARVDIALIRDALNELPEKCWYHGDQLIRTYGVDRNKPCCDTGMPALRRQVAEEALKRLEEAL